MVNPFGQGWEAWAVIMLIGFLPNEVWRWLGVLLGRRVEEGSEVFVWVRAVAAAIIAAFVARTLLFPTASLAALPVWLRLGAAGTGISAFFLARRSVLAAILAGEAVVLAGAWWIGL